MDPYLTLKWLHILSSTVLFGTGIGTAFQMVHAFAAHARHGGGAGIVHAVSAGVVRADWIFTTPAGVIQPATGLALIHLAGWSWGEPWLLATYALYLLAFACWLPVVGLQIRIRDMTAGLPDPAPVPPAVWRLFRIWFVLGWPAFAALVAVFWLMVSKPQF
jgi:uncharacterized membrane protein